MLSVVDGILNNHALGGRWVVNECLGVIMGKVLVYVAHCMINVCIG